MYKLCKPGLCNFHIFLSVIFLPHYFDVDSCTLAIFVLSANSDEADFCFIGVADTKAVSFICLSLIL